MERRGLALAEHARRSVEGWEIGLDGSALYALSATAGGPGLSPGLL